MITNKEVGAIAFGGYHHRQRRANKFRIDIEDNCGGLVDITVSVQTGADPKNDIAAPVYRVQYGEDLGDGITAAIIEAADILSRHRKKYPEKWST